MVPTRFTAVQNLLLVFCPLGVLGWFLEMDHMTIFTLNFIALLPLAGLLGEVPIP